MEKLRLAVAQATERVARSRQVRSLRGLDVPASGTTNDERGQGLAEYALILALIAIVAIISLIFLGGSITQLFDDIINEGFRYVDSVLGNP